MTSYATARVKLECACGRRKLFRSFACQECLRDMGVGQVLAHGGGIRSTFTLVQPGDFFRHTQHPQFVEVAS